LLDGVFRLRVVPQYGARGAVKHAVVKTHQLLHGIRVARQNLGDELGIARAFVRKSLHVRCSVQRAMLARCDSYMASSCFLPAMSFKRGRAAAMRSATHCWPRFRNRMRSPQARMASPLR